MTRPIVIANNVAYEDWDLHLEEGVTLEKNMQDLVKLGVDEVWGTLDAEIHEAGLAIGTIRVSSSVEETYAYFDIKEMAHEAIHLIATNYSELWREKNIEGTRRHLRAVRSVFAEVVELFDEAIANPLEFTEPRNTSQKGPEWEEKLKYIRDMCGGS